MTNKELIIQNFNKFIEETLVPKKLEIILEHEDIAGLAIETLKLVDIYASEAESSSFSDKLDVKDYSTLVHVFKIQNTSFELSTDVNYTWQGLYPVDNYKIKYENKRTEFINQVYGYDTFDDFGFHFIFNKHNYMDIIGGRSVFIGFQEDYLKELSTNLADIKLGIPDISSVKATSFTECTLQFKGKFPFTVPIYEVQQNIEKHKKSVSKGEKNNEH